MQTVSIKDSMGFSTKFPWASWRKLCKISLSLMTRTHHTRCLSCGMVEMVIPTIETATKLVLMMLTYLIMGSLEAFYCQAVKSLSLCCQTCVWLLNEVPHEFLIFWKLSRSKIFFFVLFKFFTCLFHFLHNPVSFSEIFFTAWNVCKIWIFKFVWYFIHLQHDSM